MFGDYCDRDLFVNAFRKQIESLSEAEVGSIFCAKCLVKWLYFFIGGRYWLWWESPPFCCDQDSERTCATADPLWVISLKSFPQSWSVAKLQSEDYSLNIPRLNWLKNLFIVCSGLYECRTMPTAISELENFKRRNHHSSGSGSEEGGHDCHGGFFDSPALQNNMQFHANSNSFMQDSNSLSKDQAEQISSSSKSQKYF